MPNLKYFLLFTTLFTFNIFGCGDDEEIEIKEDSIPSNITPENISAKLEFLNAMSSYLSGDLPSPPASKGNPVLENNGIDSLVITSDSTFLISMTETTGADIKGVFLKLENSKGYFNLILKDMDQGGRFYETNPYHLVTRFSETIEPGAYCLSYAVYDANDNISNTINLCIVVQNNESIEDDDEDDTDNNLSLTSTTWRWTSIFTQQIYEGDTTEITETIGETDSGTYTETIHCSDNTFKKFEVTNSYRTNYTYLTLSTDSSLVIEISAYEKEFDSFNSTCETGVIYIEETDEVTAHGTWSYSETTKSLTTIITYDIDGEQTVVTMNYEAELENNQLILHAYIDTGMGIVYIQEHTLEPKNQ